MYEPFLQPEREIERELARPGFEELLATVVLVTDPFRALGGNCFGGEWELLNFPSLLGVRHEAPSDVGQNNMPPSPSAA